MARNRLFWMLQDLRRQAPGEPVHLESIELGESAGKWRLRIGNWVLAEHADAEQAVVDGWTYFGENKHILYSKRKDRPA
jgi:hypothetical protein